MACLFFLCTVLASSALAQTGAISSKEEIEAKVFDHLAKLIEIRNDLTEKYMVGVCATGGLPISIRWLT